MLIVNFDSNLKIPEIYNDLDRKINDDIDFDDKITDWLMLRVGSFHYDQ